MNVGNLLARMAFSLHGRGRRAIASRTREAEAAANVRVWARGLSFNVDRERIFQQVEGLEREARELERKVTENDPPTKS